MANHSDTPASNVLQDLTQGNRGPYIDLAPLIAKDRANGNNVCLSLLATYAQCLGLRDEDLSWQAQLMFHKAQMARGGGGTMAHKLGGQLKSFLREHGAAGEVNK
jgi:hypothetical protein